MQNPQENWISKKGRAKIAFHTAVLIAAICISIWLFNYIVGDIEYTMLIRVGKVIFVVFWSAVITHRAKFPD